MESRTREVLDLALQLPPSEQEELLAELAGSLGAADEDVERAWAEEATRRWVAIASGQVETIPWQEVRSALKERLGA